MTDHRLRFLAGEAIFARGRQYYAAGRVTPVSLNLDSAHIHVTGQDEYCIDLVAGRLEFSGECNCRFDGSGICKHIVAAAMFLRDHLEAVGGPDWKVALDRFLKNSGAPAKATPRGKPYHLLFSLRNQYDSWSLQPFTLEAAELINGREHAGELSSTAHLTGFIQHNPWVVNQARQPSRSLIPALCVNATPAAVSIANLINRTERMGGSYYYYSYTRPIDEYLALLAGNECPIYLGTQQVPLKTLLTLHAQPGELKIHVRRTPGEGVRLEARISQGEYQFPLEPRDTRVLSESPLWLLAGNNILRMTDENSATLLEIFLDTPQVHIHPEDESEFLETYLLPIADATILEGEEIQWEDVDAAPVKRLYLGETPDGLTVQLKFGYGDYELDYDRAFPATTTRHKPDGSWTLLRVQRRPDEERAIYESISSARNGLKRAAPPFEPDTFTLRARVDMVDFLLKHVPLLAGEGFEIYGEENLKSTRVNRNSPTLSLNISSGIDWFDVVALVQFGDIAVSLKEVQRALRKTKRYVKLADGTIGELPEEWLEKYKHLFGLGEQTETGIRLSQHHVTLIDELLNQTDGSTTDAEYHRRLDNLRNFAGIQPQVLPDGFTGELRPYQKAGFDWLHFLKEYGFGGCLADDMGLGKTVQVLAFLESIVRDGGPRVPNLVVVPRSLLFNWQREAARFTPGLRLIEHFGAGRVRENADYSEFDVVLTTYGTMRRDIQALRNYAFNYIILDESQAIKNPASQVSKAARVLNARHRLVMTGTPVENSTFELWSQFAFLNPGLLGGLEYFKREFAGPIERRQDEEAARLLRKLVFPFILRRTKDQVAPELPPRSERIIYSDMEPAQKAFYERTRDYYRGVVLGMIEQQGMNDTRMKILEGLLRLRQISNHPRLVETGFRGESAKMEMLLEQLETLRSEGHKALVFSQFVQMLKLVRKELDSRKIPYSYLDGQTNDRQKKVDEFQNDPAIPFFLISLRAGGVGLNLTAADYVIHIDPWWNPAVELQATDRTHRIGQDKPVFVYKLISRDTVEEKILLLQERKKALVDQLITTESGFFKELTTDDVKVLFS